MAKSGTLAISHSWNSLIMIWAICLLCVQTNIISASITCTSSNCSLRDWLTVLKEEAYSLECIASQLEKSIALLRKTNSSSTSRRVSQLGKVNKSLGYLRGEIGIIDSSCSQFNGPDCNITKSECDAKCISCSSLGQCSICSGNWDGPTCSTCKSGWNGTECNIPKCDAKCVTCLSPGVCSNCYGNWNDTSCSTCKTGWYGSDCNSTIELILTSAQITKFTTAILPNARITSSKLLFKASRDGFSASSFHSKCDDKGPTIVIIKATSGAVFGGYAGLSWKSQSATYVTDSTSFLFSLISANKQERFTKLTQENSFNYKRGYYYLNSIHYRLNYGPTFGGGHDLNIVDMANTNTLSYSDLCLDYCDTTMSYSSDTAKNYLAGSLNFQVEDYEVYSL